MEDELRSVLYCAAGSLTGALRGRGEVWIEGAVACRTGGVAALTFACAWHPGVVVVAGDVGARVAYVGPTAPSAVADAIAAANTARGGGGGEGGHVTLFAAAAALLRFLRPAAPAIWPARSCCDDAAAVRGHLAHAASSAVVDTARYHPAAPRARCARDAAVSVLRGLAATLALLSNALGGRREAVASPLPVYAYHAALCQHLRAAPCGAAACSLAVPRAAGAVPPSAGSSSTAVAGASPKTGSSAPTECDADVLRQGIAAAPTSARWCTALAALPDDTDSWSEARDVIHRELAALPPSTLWLLHWLLVAAPVRLIALPPRSSPRDASSALPPGSVSFAVVHGGWDAALLPHGAGSDAVVRPWEVSAAAGGRRYVRDDGGDTCVWYHGTGTDSLYSTMCNGVRNLSGTRHESTGAMYGPGIYLTNEAGVATAFTRRSGACWPGHGIGPPVPAAAAVGGCVPPEAWRRTPLRGVLQWDVVAAPGNRLFRNGEQLSAAAAAGGAIAVPPATYLVVPDGRHAHITALHLYPDDDGDEGSDAAGVSSAEDGTTPHNGAAGDGAACCSRPSVRYLFLALLVALAAVAFRMMTIRP